MYNSKLRMTIIITLLVGHAVFASVPAPHFRRPQLPYFMQSMNFQSLRMRVMNGQYIGMIPDRYADLIINPAYINFISTRSLYIDFTDPGLPAFSSTPLLSTNAYNDGHFVRPGWYSFTRLNSMDVKPHYNFAALLPVTNRIHIGFSHRLLFDYGPYLKQHQHTVWTTKNNYSTINPQLMRLEVNRNQQTITGSITELIAGLKLSSRLYTGLRLGHYLYRQDGNMFNSKWGNFPHNSFADLDNDKLSTDGDHLETGLGLMFRITQSLLVGAYGAFTVGDGQYSVSAQDTSNYWQEDVPDTVYYHRNHFLITSQQKSKSVSHKPSFSIMIEWKPNSVFTLRSAFIYTRLNNELTGSIVAQDTSNRDQTYDERDNNVYYFRRQQNEGFGISWLSGNGDETTKSISCFISAIYHPNQNWTLFSGLHIQRQNYHYEIDESSSNENGNLTTFSLYKPETIKTRYFDDKKYSIYASGNRFTASLPVGLFAHIYHGFSIIIGTDVVISIAKSDASGELLYFKKSNQYWENENLVVNDQEENRLEKFSSQAPKIFDRSTHNYIGFQYTHPSGTTFYVKSAGGELFNSTKWVFGFEYAW